MKTRLEIVWCPDGTAFLNFFDNVNGKDVCCQIDTGGKLVDESGGGKEITFAEFISRVESVVAPFTEQLLQPENVLPVCWNENCPKWSEDICQSPGKCIEDVSG